MRRSLKKKEALENANRESIHGNSVALCVNFREGIRLNFKDMRIPLELYL